MEDTHSPAVTVPFREHHLTMPVWEAEELYEQLGHAIKRAKQRHGELLHAELTPEGFLSRDAVYEFFVQIYPEPDQLRNHAAKLFGQVCKLVGYGSVRISVLCPDCQQLIGPGVACNNSKNRGHWHVERLLINAASLTDHAREILDGTFRNIGPSLKEDLKTLVAHL